MYINQINILVACEESDEVRGRLAAMGFNAWACDIQPNRNPNANHFKCSLEEVINGFYKCNCGNVYPERWGKNCCSLGSTFYQWDVMIGFPPCTDICVSGSAWFEQKRKDGRQQAGIDFFMMLVNADIKHIAIENPVGIMSKVYKKPNQIIHPFYFGDMVSKKTCLWLKKLPLLYHNKSINLFDDKISHVKPHFTEYESIRAKSGIKRYSGVIMNTWYKSKEERSRERSKTFPGIAQAMAEQWGKYLIEHYNLKNNRHEQQTK